MEKEGCPGWKSANSKGPDMGDSTTPSGNQPTMEGWVKGVARDKTESVNRSIVSDSLQPHGL